MQRIKFIIGMLALIGTAFAIFFVLRSEHALLVHPKGIIARKELELIRTQIGLMLIVVLPTLIALFIVAWKYRAKSVKPEQEPEPSSKGFRQWILWIIPSLIIAAMSVVSWRATHDLDPHKPIESKVRSLTIQVVALDWKWLFIYPEQGIASLNFVQFPENTPIHFSLSADGSPMNSFWIPQLSGQIYTMTEMVTSLHIMADEPGEYVGRAAEINGAGFAGMTFIAKATTLSDFEKWVEKVKQSATPLTNPVYNELVRPSPNHPVTLYSSVERDLFDTIVMKYMHPSSKTLWQTPSLEN